MIVTSNETGIYVNINTEVRVKLSKSDKSDRTESRISTKKTQVD